MPLPLVGYPIALTSACASCVSQGRSHINMCFLCRIDRVGSRIKMCFLCPTGPFSHQHVLPVSHRAVLTSTCASCVTQGRISHQYVLPMSHRARSHINMCFLCHIGPVLPPPVSYRVSPMSHIGSFLFLCSRSQFCSFYLLLSIYFFSDFTPPEEVVRSSPHSLLFFLLLLFFFLLLLLFFL